MELAQVVIRTALLTAMMHVLAYIAARNHLPGIDAFLELIRFGAFVPFAASGAASMNNYRAAIIAILALTLLLGWPVTTAQLGEQITPIGVGTVLGALARRLTEQQR